MTTELATTSPGEVMENVIIKGDLSKLTPQERSEYYLSVCKSVGLNPLTKPFEYILLNGKLTLYALRACTDQLRQIHGISAEIVDRVMNDGLLTVHVRVRNKDGRQDEDFGVVTLGALKGDAAANAMMKAVTKAKRRATLSLCGLGWLDETEIETIPSAKAYQEPAQEAAPEKPAPPKPKPAPKPPAPAPKPAPKPAKIEPPMDPISGEVSPHAIHVTSVDGKFNWIGFGQSFLAALKSSKDGDECQQWDDANRQNMQTMEKQAPDVYKRLTAAIDTQVTWTRQEPAQVEDKQQQSNAEDLI